VSLGLRGTVQPVGDAITTLEEEGRQRLAGKRLAITMSPEIRAPSPAHELLVAFHFGHDPAVEPCELIVNPGLDPVAGDDVFECWWYRGDVQHKRTGDIRIAECEDYALVILQREDAPPGQFREVSHAAYRDLLEALKGTGHGHLARIWNYFSDINAGDGDAEKYRQFSIGRAEAFDEVGLFDTSVPAGTAVGSDAGGLSIIALVSKHDFFPAENPRQVSAYRYPRQYGPKSPKFARAGCVGTQDHHLFLISGTAAIIGHESAHPYDTKLQLEETLDNLEHLARAMSDAPGGGPEMKLDNDSILRVYLRDASDLEPVAERLRAQLGSIDRNVVFLRADICRRELMVEIDGVRYF
jgi:chorismate lyase/3-hydroxybenzoate synthase